jgi:hypothetical protein
MCRVFDPAFLCSDLMAAEVAGIVVRGVFTAFIFSG